MNGKAVEASACSLWELVSTLDLPQRVIVSEGSSNVDISTGDVMLVRQKRQMKYVLGVTAIDKRKVHIPLDCELRTEIPHARCMSKSIETVEQLTSKQILHHVKYARVLNDYQRENHEEMKKGEILHLLFCNGEDLIAMNSQGREVSLPLSCSAGFHLLNDDKEYTLKELVDEEMLPRFLRFVQPVPWDIRETFIEDSHIYDLGVFYVEKEIQDKEVVEVIFDAECDEDPVTLWLPLNDNDITVSPLSPDQLSSISQHSPVGSEKLTGKIGQCTVNRDQPGTRSSQTGSRSSHTGTRSSHTGTRSGHTGSRSSQTGSRSSHTGTRSSHTGTRSGQTGSRSSHTGTRSGQTGTRSGQITSKSFPSDFKADQSNPDQSGSNSSQTSSYSFQIPREHFALKHGQPSSNSGQSGKNTGQTCYITGTSSSEPNKEFPKMFSTDKKHLQLSYKKTSDDKKKMESDKENRKNKKTKRIPTDELPSLPVDKSWSKAKHHQQESNCRQATTHRDHVTSSSSAIGGRADDVYPSSDLSNLTVEDVKVLLEYLNLGSHAERFAYELVDGAMLIHLDDVMLMEVFGFTKFHALKLTKFIKGYRPHVV